MSCLVCNQIKWTRLEVLSDLTLKCTAEKDYTIKIVYLYLKSLIKYLKNSLFDLFIGEYGVVYAGTIYSKYMRTYMLFFHKSG